MKIVMCVPESTLVQNIQQFPAGDPILQKLQQSPGINAATICALALDTWGLEQIRGPLFF
jgi:hypothetical protein